MPIRSSSFSDSIPPLYEHGSAHSSGVAPLSQTELYSYSRNRVLAQEEIGGAQARSSSSRDRSKGNQAQAPTAQRSAETPRRSTPTPRRSTPTARRSTPTARQSTPAARRSTPHTMISKPLRDSATQRGHGKLGPSTRREVRAQVQRTRPTEQTSARRRSHAGSVDVEYFEHRHGPGENDDGDDEHLTQDEDDDEYDGSQVLSGEEDDISKDQDDSDDLGSEDERSSGENEDSDEESVGLISKPDGEVGRPGRGGYTLSASLGWREKDYKQFRNVVKKYMNQTLDLSQSFGEQEIESINLVCKLVTKKLPILSSYEDAWPIKDVIRVQLKYQRAQQRLKETQADAELGRRFKKARRG